MFNAMQAIKARVENGRYVIDEKAEWPEGTELYLVPMDDTDELSADQRLALHESIREGLADMRAGRTEDTDAVIAELRARR